MSRYGIEENTRYKIAHPQLSYRDTNTIYIHSVSNKMITFTTDFYTCGIGAADTQRRKVKLYIHKGSNIDQKEFLIKLRRNQKTMFKITKA